MPQTFSFEDAAGPAPSPTKKTFSFEDAQTAPAPDAKKPLLAGKFVDAVTDPFREVGHEFMEGSRAVGRAEKEPYNPLGEDLQILPGITKRGLGIAGGVGEQLGSPVTGFLTSVLGRPVETATGGKIKRESVGNAVSMAAPVVGEAMETANLAKTAKEMGLSMEATKALMARSPKPLSAGQAARQAKDPQLGRNVTALEQAGIKPSLAVAGTGKNVRRATQTLAPNIFMGQPLRNALNRTATGFKDRLATISPVKGEPLGAAGAGDRVKTGITNWAQTPRIVRQAIESRAPNTQIAVGRAVKSIPSQRIGFGTKSDNLYGAAKALTGEQGANIDMSTTRGVLTDLMMKFRHPGLSQQFQNPALRELFTSIDQTDGKLSFDDARRLRTVIRSRLKGDPALRATINDAEINSLYNAMSSDMYNGAKRLGGPKAEKAWRDADNFYRAGQSRIENTLSKYYGKDAEPASVFHDLLASAQGGSREDLGRLNQVKKSLTPEDWQEFSASVIDHMGRALPGQRSEETPFSIGTFLTNYNKLDTRGARASSDTDSGLKLLFGGALNREKELPETMRNLQRVATQWKELEKLANHSNSGNVLGNMVTGSGLSGAVVGHHPLFAAVSLLTGNTTSALLGDPTFVRWLAGLPASGTPAETQAAVKQLSRWIPAAAGSTNQSRETQ